MKQLFTLLFSAFFFFHIQAQTVGDYRTISSGNWIALPIWQTFNGDDWVAATTIPSSINGQITIRTGHNVSISDNRTIDQTIIEEGANITISHSNGNLTINNGDGDDLIVNGGISLSLGTIQGVGTIQVNTGTFSWNSGTVANLTMNISAAGSLNMAGLNKTLSHATINNYGAAAWSAGNLLLYYAANISNYGSLTLSGNAGIQQSPTLWHGCFVANKSTGTITRLGGGTSTFNIGAIYTLTNEGNIYVRNGGVLDFKRNGNHSGAVHIEETGKFILDNTGTELNLNEGVAFSGSGAVEIFGSIKLNHVINVEDITLTQISGSIEGTGTLNFNGAATYNWNGGWVAGNTTVNIAPTATLNMGSGGSGTRAVSGTAKLNNYGTANWLAGSLYLNANNPEFNNYGTLTLSNDVGIITTNSVNTGASFNNKNTGTLIRLDGTSDFSPLVDIVVSNEGTISGTGIINMNEFVNFTNTGIIAPGASPGILTLNGEQPLSATSVLNIKIQNGTGAGIGHSQLARNGNLTLAGTLTVTETGTVPLGAYTIVELSSGTISGTFSTINIPSGYSLTINESNIQLHKNVLPLKLISFTAKVADAANNGNNNCAALLQWHTADEENVSHFEIEESIDGSSFRPAGGISSIPAQNTLVKNNYTTVVALNSTVAYYRLKMVDIDGQFSYSPIVTLSTNCYTQKVSVYPNPVKDKIYIQGINAGDKYRLINSNGQLILSGIATRATQEINTTSLSTGLYILHIVGKDGREQKIKLIKE